MPNGKRELWTEIIASFPTAQTSGLTNLGLAALYLGNEIYNVDNETKCILQLREISTGIGVGHKHELYSIHN